MSKKTITAPNDELSLPSQGRDEMPTVTVLAPVLNEEESLKTLYEEVAKALIALGKGNFELIFVDDGSTDSSWSTITELVDLDARVRGIRLRRNFGKAVALATGIKQARAEILITMDSDLQDDPREIPRFLAKMDEGIDLVCGWKENRHDPISKTAPSILFNTVVRRVTGIKLHDFNCCFKAGLTEAFRGIPLYGELHRFVPVFVHNLGYRIGELSVEHRPRRFGHSKYGMERFVRGFLDLLTVATITRYRSRPSHLIGGIGVLFGILGSVILLYLVGIKLFAGQLIGGRPLLLLGVLLQILSVQFIFFGVLAELVINRGWSGGDPESPVAERRERQPKSIP